MLAAARASGVTLIYTLFPSPSPDKFPVIGDVVPGVAPKGDEPVVTSFVDKFILGDKDTGLKQMLKARESQRSFRLAPRRTMVLFTAVSAALRGYNVVVPVDGYRGTTAMRIRLPLTR